MENSISSQNYDGLIIVASPNHTVKIKEIAKLLEITAKYDAATGTETVVLPLPAFPASRLVYAPTGPIDVDYDDVRVFKKAAVKGVQRALKAGIKKPLLVLDEEDTHFANVGLAIVLGALEALYVVRGPIQAADARAFVLSSLFDLLSQIPPTRVQISETNLIN